MALMAPWLQNLGNYPVETAGLVMAPRGFGNLCTIVLSGRLSQRIDARLMVAVGLLIECWSFWIMTGWTPDVSQHELIMAIILQGAGLGLVFTPLQMLAFAKSAMDRSSNIGGEGPTRTPRSRRGRSHSMIRPFGVRSLASASHLDRPSP